MDGADQQTEYEYDENGNLTKDLNKKISRITYNFLNLPKEIMFMDGSYIHYTYDAAGTLLRKGYYVGEELTEISGDDEEELTGFCLPDTHLMSVGDEEEEEKLVLNVSPIKKL